MSNIYKELTSRQQQEFNNFPMFFAFSQNQFNEKVIALGLKPTDKDKIYSVGNGGFIRASDSTTLDELLEKHNNELKSSIEQDKTGEGFIYDMFHYELNNHEYSYTREIDDTLDALDLTIDEVYDNELLLHGLKKACDDIVNCIE